MTTAPAETAASDGRVHRPCRQQLQRPKRRFDGDAVDGTQPQPHKRLKPTGGTVSGCQPPQRQRQTSETTPTLRCSAGTPVGVAVLAMAAAATATKDDDLRGVAFRNPLSEIRREVFPSSSFPTPQTVRSARVASSELQDAIRTQLPQDADASPRSVDTQSPWVRTILQIPLSVFRTLQDDTLDRLSVHIDRLQGEIQRIQTERSPSAKNSRDVDTPRVSPLTSLDTEHDVNHDVDSRSDQHTDSDSAFPNTHHLTHNNDASARAVQSSPTPDPSASAASSSSFSPSTRTNTQPHSPHHPGRPADTVSTHHQDLQLRHRQLVEQKACLKCHKTGWTPSFTDCCCRHHRIKPNCLVCDECHGHVGNTGRANTATNNHNESSLLRQRPNTNTNAGTAAPVETPFCDHCQKAICIFSKACTGCSKQLCTWCFRRHDHAWEQCRSNCGPHCRDCKQNKLLNESCCVCNEPLCNDCDYQRCRWCTELVCNACSPKVWTVSNLDDGSDDDEANERAQHDDNEDNDDDKENCERKTLRDGGEETSSHPPPRRWTEEDHGRNGPGACNSCLDRAREAGYFYFYKKPADE